MGSGSGLRRWMHGLLAAGLALAAPGVRAFEVGDHVTYDAIGISGTIVKLGGPSGTVMMVRDDLPRTPTSGNWYDPKNLRATPAPAAEAEGGDGPGDPAAVRPEPGDGSQEPLMDPAGAARGVPDEAPADETTFKAVIRAAQAEPAADVTRSFDFQAFEAAGPETYEAPYQGHLDQGTILGGRGHVYQAYKVHTRLVVTDRYQDPKADDMVTTREMDYMIYRDQHGHWVADSQGTSRLIGVTHVPRP